MFHFSTADDWSLAGTIGSGGLHTSFHRKANENVQVGVEFESSLRTMDSVTSLVYQIDVPKMDLLFRGEAAECLLSYVVDSMVVILNFLKG